MVSLDQRDPFQRRTKVLILNFHRLGPTRHAQADPYQVEPKLFARILEIVRQRRDVQITFDDSFESDYEIALPLLKSFNMVARFFILANRVDQTGFLSRTQIRSLCAEGMTIGSHGMHHRKWQSLSDRELEEEIVEARDRIEQLTEVKILEVACPFGGYNRRVLRHLRKARYERVFTSDGGFAIAESWLQPRNTVVGSDNLEKVISVIDPVPSNSKTIWHSFKIALKRWR